MSTMTINGRPAPLPDHPDALLVDVIRDRLGLTGTKLVCRSGVCGACTVLLDSVPVVGIVAHVFIFILGRLEPIADPPAT